MRTPISDPPVPMYAEFESHRIMIRDAVRTDAFQRAISAAVSPGDVVLDVGAGSGILSLFAAQAGASRVYAVEQTAIAALAEELAAANGFTDVITVIQGDLIDVEFPELADVVVSEWLGGFGIDEGMLLPVAAARERWLRPGGTMVPASVTTWTALIEDPYIGKTLDFLRGSPYGLDLAPLTSKTVDEIFYSGGFRYLAATAQRSAAAALWTDDMALATVERARQAHEGEVVLPVTEPGSANALALWFSAELAEGITMSNGPGHARTHWGTPAAPLREAVTLAPGMEVRARVRTAPARELGTWTSWAVALPGGEWEEHDEQSVWVEIDG